VLSGAARWLGRSRGLRVLTVVRRTNNGRTTDLPPPRKSNNGRTINGIEGASGLDLPERGPVRNHDRCARAGLSFNIRRHGSATRTMDQWRGSWGAAKVSRSAVTGGRTHGDEH
jgi:hypothetical protein